MWFIVCYNKVVIFKKIKDGVGIIKNGKINILVVFVINVVVFVECWW